MKILIYILLPVILISCLNKSQEKTNIIRIRDFDIISFGEYHGTKELPQYFFSLVKEFALENKKTNIFLGLEIPTSEEEHLQKFILTGDDKYLKNSNFFYKEYQDGRSSEAIVQGIKSLKEQTNITIFCFDQNLPYNKKRDEVMAKNITKKIPTKSVTFLYSGNLHPRKKIGTPWDKKFKSMGLFLDELSNKKILSIRGEFRGGSAWTCSGMTPDTCGINKVGDISSGVAKDTTITLSPSLKNGYDAFVLLESVTASKPWRDSH